MSLDDGLNEVAAVQAVIDLIKSRESDLLAGIVHQGRQRVLGQVTSTNLTPPTGYYYILVYCTDSHGRSRTAQGRVPTNVRQPSRVYEYDIQVEISDEALVSQNDLNREAYETMAQDFRLFGQRMFNLFEQQGWFGTTPKSEIKRLPGEGDRLIEKFDLSGAYPDTEESDVATLYTQIKFTLVQQC